jgi:hypothetical protein
MWTALTLWEEIAVSFGRERLRGSSAQVLRTSERRFWAAAAHAPEY